MSSSPGAGQQENWSSITTTSKSSLSSKDFKLLSEDCNDGEIEPDVSSTSLTSIKAKDIMGDGHYGGGINNSNKISRSSSGSSDNVSNPSARLVSSSSNNSDTTSSMTMEASKSNVNNIGMTSRSTDTPKSSGANLTKLEKKKKMEKKKKRKGSKISSTGETSTASSTKASRSRSNSNAYDDSGYDKTYGGGTKKKEKKAGHIKKKKKKKSDNVLDPRRLPTVASRSSSSHPITSQASMSHSATNTTTRVKKKRKGESATGEKASNNASSSLYDPSGGSGGKGNHHSNSSNNQGFSAAQAAVNDMMRCALEEDQYSAFGSIVNTESSDDEQNDRNILLVKGNGFGNIDGSSGTTTIPTSKRSGGGNNISSTAMYTPTSMGGQPRMARLDRSLILNAMRTRLRMEALRSSSSGSGYYTTSFDGSGKIKKRSSSILTNVEDYGGSNNIMGTIGDGKNEESIGGGVRGCNRKKKRKKGKRGASSKVRMDTEDIVEGSIDSNGSGECIRLGGNAQDNTQNNDFNESDLKGDKAMRNNNNNEAQDKNEDDDLNFYPGAEESSIFGQTTGSSNATWVECDRCKKWRRLRGVVDAKKLPSKWYCSMNHQDPERAKCSAPEEEYNDAQNIIPESATDQRTRKHLRLWVRRLQCNENYEARQMTTMTRGKKRSNTMTMSTKEPYEWVRCCNPSCGKWRSLLRSMEACSSVIDSARNGKWYCVLNTWDEKTASCAAPQENLPVLGCPPWVLQDSG